MSARKGYLLPSPKYTTIMSCSESSPGNAFLVDSLINGRTDGGAGHYPGSAVCVPQSSATELPYGLHNYGYFPGMSKRGEVGSHNVVSGSGAYMSGMEMWMDAQRSCRMDQEQTVGPQVAPCSFPQNIKEESNYCLYEPQKCSKAATTENLTYSRLGTVSSVSGSCTVTDGGDGGSVPVPGYFRLSQIHAHSHKLYNGPQPNPSHSHFGIHPPTPVRFHTPTTPKSPVQVATQESRTTEGSVSSGHVTLQSHPAPLGEEQRRGSEEDTEDSSAEETEGFEKEGAANGRKGGSPEVCR